MAPRPEMCVGGIAIRKSEILMIQRGPGSGEGLWSIPGGRVEFGETLSDAVVRELAEETGLTVLCGEFVGWVERMSSHSHYVVADFLIEVLGGTLRPGDDAADARWVPLEELPRLSLVDGVLEFLQHHHLVQ